MIGDWLFFLDGNRIPNPDGWKNTAIEVNRIEGINGLYTINTGAIIFNGSAYDYLYSRLNSDDFVTTIEVVIQRDTGAGYQLFFEGVMWVSDIEFSLRERTAKAQLIDKTWAGAINTSKKNTVYPTSALSKDGVTAITPVTPVDIDFFNPLTGTYTYTNGKTFKVGEVLEYLVGWMTNGQVAFASDYFSPSGEGYVYGLIRGLELRTRAYNSTNHQPVVSFESLMTQLNKKLNLGFSIQDDGSGQLVLRVEPSQYFQNSSAVLTLDNVNGILAKIRSDALFSTVRVGDDNFKTTGYLPSITLESHFEEWLNNISNSNQDVELDLVTGDGYTVDANVIADILLVGNIEWDTLNIIVEVDWAGGQAVKGVVSSTNLCYNKTLLNGFALERWANTLPINFATRAGTGNDGFQATRVTAAQIDDLSLIVAPAAGTIFIANDDTTLPNYDATANYNIVNGRYTAPASGTYSFRFKPRLLCTDFAAGTVIGTYYPILEVYDAGSVLKTQHFISLDGDGIPTTLTLSAQSLSVPFGGASDPTMDTGGAIFPNIIMNATDYAVVRLYWETISQPTAQVLYLLGSGFRTEYTQNGGGIPFGAGYENSLPIQYTFEYPLTCDELLALRSNLRNGIDFRCGEGAYFRGYVDKVTYSVKSGLTKFEVLGKFDE